MMKEKNCVMIGTGGFGRGVLAEGQGMEDYDPGDAGPHWRPGLHLP
jgi:hypothetical protein